MPNPYRLFLDRQAGKLLRSTNPYQLTSLQEAINAGDDSQIPIELIPLDSLDGGGYEVASYATDDVRIAIGNPEEQPTSGTFVLDHDAYTSEVFHVENLNADSLERGLNGINSINAAGGVQVVSVGQGYVVKAIQNGALGAISADEISLSPHGSVKIIELAPGTATTKAQYQINLVSDPYALLTTWSAISAASISISTTKAGTTTQFETQTISITGAVKGGYFTITDGTTVSAPISYDAGATAVEDAVNGVLGASTVTVTKPNSCCWDIRWAAVGNQGILTITSALTSWTGLAGTIQLNTVSLASSIVGKTSISAAAQIIETISASDEKHVYHEHLEIKETIIANATLTTIANELLPSLKGTAVFTDYTTETPDFIGQIAVETDTGIIWRSTGTTVGDWEIVYTDTNTRVSTGAELAAALSAGVKHINWVGTTLTDAALYIIPTDTTLHITPGYYIDFGGVANARIACYGTLDIDPGAYNVFRNVYASGAYSVSGATDFPSIAGYFGGEVSMSWWLPTAPDSTTVFTSEFQACVDSNSVNKDEGRPFPASWVNDNIDTVGGYRSLAVNIPVGGIVLDDTINLSGFQGVIRGEPFAASAISFQNLDSSTRDCFSFASYTQNFRMKNLYIHVDASCYRDDIRMFHYSKVGLEEGVYYDGCTLQMEKPGDFFSFDSSASEQVNQMEVRRCHVQLQDQDMIPNIVVTTGSSHAEDLTITLPGVTVSTISVSASGSTTTTATEIAEQITSEVANWTAVATGSTVKLTPASTPANTAYSLTGATSAVTTFGRNSNFFYFDSTLSGVHMTIAQNTFKGVPISVHPDMGSTGINMLTVAHGLHLQGNHWEGVETHYYLRGSTGGVNRYVGAIDAVGESIYNQQSHKVIELPEPVWFGSVDFSLQDNCAGGIFRHYVDDQQHNGTAPAKGVALPVKLTVTTGAGAENVTITLGGQTKVIAVTGTTTAQTATQIASADFSAVGSGWTASVVDSVVTFRSLLDRVAEVGDYSMTSDGTAVGSFTTGAVSSSALSYQSIHYIASQGHYSLTVS